MSSTIGPEGFVYLAVPATQYSEIVRFIADLADKNVTIAQTEDEGELLDVPAIDETVDEEEAGAAWTVADLVTFSTTATKATQLASRVMDVLSAKPGDRLSTTELVDHLDVERTALRSALSALTRHLRAHWDSRPWPFSWTWGPHLGEGHPAEMLYAVTPEVADRWRQARSA